jgi:hypothetical protein
MLKRDIDALTASYEAGKQTLAQYAEKHEQVITAYQEQSVAQQKTYNELDIEADKASALIDELKRLSAASDGSAESQAKIASIAGALNEILPNLAINYDLLNGGSEEYLKLLEEEAIAQAKAADFEAAKKDRGDRVASRKGLEDDVAAAKAQLELLEIEYRAALAEKEATLSIYTDIEGFEYYSYGREETKKVDAVASQYNALKKILDTATEAYEENEGAIAGLEREIGVFVEAEEVAYEKTGRVKDVISAATAEVEALTIAYNEAYAAAKKSVEGQFELWDKAEKVTAVKTGDINTALDTQIDYWNKYNANLETVSARTGEIEGLQEVIASFADGSPESIAAIAGMATATDEELAAMVTKWQELHKEQESVETYLADLKVDFDEGMKAITDSLEQQIAGMNVSEEAEGAGRATIDAFIAAAEDMLPEVEAAYKRLSEAAYGALEPHTLPVSGVGGYPYNSSVGAYAGGTTNSTGAFIAGENGPELVVGAPGSTVFPASETNRIIDAFSGGRGSGEPSIVFSPTYTINGGDSPELRQTFDENEQSFFDRLDAWWDEKQANNGRRAFA